MIADISQALAEHLLARTTDIGPNWIEIASLESGATLTKDRLQICLYAIEEHAHLRNAPLVQTPGGWERAPLGLRLHYLMHYSGTNHLEAQSRLTRVVQVFHSTPVLGPESLSPTLANTVDRLGIHLYSPSAEERNNLWSAFGRGLRLSVYYQVDVALIPPVDQDGDGTVVEHRIEFAELTS